jgi:hypothetical protein
MSNCIGCLPIEADGYHFLVALYDNGDDGYGAAVELSVTHVTDRELALLSLKKNAEKLAKALGRVA